MRFAVISDVHSNIISLNLAIADALKNKVDQFIFLGDYTTDFDKNNEVLEIIQKYGNHIVKGNREGYMLNYDPLRKDFANYTTIANTYNNLTKENLEYIKHLADHKIINVNGYKILIIHGDVFGEVQEGLETIFQNIIDKYDFDICLLGHFHIHLNCIYNNHRFINPGSIGSPSDSPTYKYVILDVTSGINVELREFDVDDTYDELVNQYKQSSYYNENFEWSDLILKSIKSGYCYFTKFLNVLSQNLKQIDSNDSRQFNRCWRDTYLDFIEKYNEMDFKKLNVIFKENKLTNTKAFFKFCKNKIDSGWLDKNKIVHLECNDMTSYLLQSPIELLESRVGNSWDKTELSRIYFNRTVIVVETYFMYYYVDTNNCPSHSIIVYYKNNKVYWFEPTLKNEQYNHCGIHEYNSIEQLLADFKKHFTLNGIANGLLPHSLKNENYFCYRYQEPKYHITEKEFFEHCKESRKIDI